MSEPTSGRVQTPDEGREVWPGHTMVRSVRGPKNCCKECSLSRGSYVEWPCSSAQISTYMLLGSLARNPL